MTQVSDLMPTAADTVEVDEKRLAEVQGVVNSLVKTIKIFRTYPRKNAISTRAIDELTETFTQHLNKRRTMELFIDRTEFQWQGVPVYANDDQRTSLALKMDRDGVRRLTFHQGLTREEILGFLEIITSEISDDSLEDDFVTLLWEKQFAHIKAFILDDMSSGDNGYDSELVDRDGPGDDAEDHKSKDSNSPSKSTMPPMDTASPGDPSFQHSLCSEVKNKIEAPSKEAALRLAESVDREPVTDVAADLADILFDVLYSEVQEDLYGGAVKVLVELVMMHVKKLNFVEAMGILKHLRGMAAGDQLGKEVRAQIVGALLSLADFEHTQGVIDAVKNAEEINENQLERFLTMLPVQAAPTLCQILDLSPRGKAAVSALKTLVKDEPEILAPVLADTSLETGRLILDIFNEVAKPKLAEALSAPLEEASADLRLASIPLLTKLGSVAAREILLSYVAQPSIGLRRSSLKALSGFPVDKFQESPTLRLQVAETGFHECPLQDKKMLLVTIAHLEGPHAVDFLGAIVGHRKWFERRHHIESRACAALALGEVGNGRAHELLERSETDRKDAVRTASRMALSRMEFEATPVGS